MSEPCGLNFSHLGKLSDEVLMAHLKAGHDDALAVLFDRYHRLVLSIAARILRDPAEAEDLMQAVFFEIFRVVGQFDPLKGSTRRWILQYTYHRCLNRRNYLNVRGLCGAGVSGRGIEPREQAFSNGCGNLTSLELVRLVQEGLAALTRSQREALELAFFEGLSMAEIADKTKESLGNVRHHYYRGLDALRFLIFAKAPSRGKVVGLQPEITDVKA
jgi:RNA polymerase sigma-70 factor (ECF subfamily)